MSKKVKAVILTVSIAIVLFTIAGGLGVRAASNDGAYRQLGVYSEVLSRIRSEYVEEPNIPQVTDGALHGLLESLDPNSSYLTPNEYKKYRSHKAEAKGQIGATISKRFGSVFEPSTAAADLALFHYTSGTTRDLPAAVRHPHRAVVVVAAAALYGTGVRPNDRFFCPSSPAWGHGLWHGTLAPLALGVQTGTMSGRFDPERLLSALHDYQITNLSAAATHYRMMKNSGAAGLYPVALQKMSFTGEPVDSETLSFAEATFGTRLCSMYGTTEVGVILADYPGAADHVPKAGAFGKPVPGVRAEVHAPNGTLCPPGRVGEIKVWRHGAWFPTKDRGYIDEDGYFWHAGRADDVIISAGWTIGPAEVEDAIMKHPGVVEAAVIGIPDETRGQIIKAFIVPKQAPSPELTREIQDLVRTRLSQHEYPRQIEFVA